MTIFGSKVEEEEKLMGFYTRLCLTYAPLCTMVQPKTIMHMCYNMTHENLTNFSHHGEILFSAREAGHPMAIFY